MKRALIIGIFAFFLLVTLPLGPTAFAQENQPEADFSYSIDGLEVHFVDESTDPNDNIIDWYWEFGDGSDSTEMNPTHTYSNEEGYTVTLYVMDNSGNTDNESKTISTGGAPMVDFSYSPKNPSINETIHFTDNSEDWKGEIVSWYWEFGDDASSEEQNPSHSYSYARPYYVNLEVTDDDGDINTLTKRVFVGKAQTSLSLSPSPVFIEVGDNVQMTATLSSGGSRLSEERIDWRAQLGEVSQTSVETDSGGRATVVYQAPPNPTEDTITSHFIGSGSYEQLEKSVEVFVTHPASLTVTPSSPEVFQGEEIELTAELTAYDNSLSGELIKWEASSGSLSQEETFTGSEGKASVTFEAPEDSLKATVTALFPRTDNYSEDEVSVDIDVKFETDITIKTDSGILRNKKIYYRLSEDGDRISLGTTGSDGKLTINDQELRGKALYLETEDGDLSGWYHLTPGSETKEAELGRESIPWPTIFMTLIISIPAAVFAFLIMYNRIKRWEKEHSPE